MNEVTEPEKSLSSRKSDHIDMAFAAVISDKQLDERFYYEPMLGSHPQKDLYPVDFLGHKLRLPIWISSMTGGTEKAGHINRNLARACGEFGMGMGLGSCRPLLDPDANIEDFDLRDLIGPGLPFFGNLGIAQLEELLEAGTLDKMNGLIDRLRLDGMIIHVNPLQEAFQPEGDRFRRPPLETIQTVLEVVDFPLIVKEVGQGMGRGSMESLLRLPLAAVDFAAAGGTNFTKLEMMRGSDQESLADFARVGHSATEMVSFTNELLMGLGDDVRCRQVIISGGIQDYLEGYYLINKLNLPAIYGMASRFLKYALQDYEVLQEFITEQARGLSLAKAFCT